MSACRIDRKVNADERRWQPRVDIAQGTKLGTPVSCNPQPPNAVNEADALKRLDEFDEIWGEKYPAIRVLWDSAWEEFIPFLDYKPDIRRVIYSTNAIESLNARFRRATRARGHFPNEQAAMKCLYLVVRSLDPKGTGQERWMNRWKPALNAFAITFEGRLF